MKNKLSIFALALLVMVPAVISAQSLKSDYFVTASYDRIKLNPAFAPHNGYIGLPLVGDLYLNVGSNMAVNTFLIPLNDGSGKLGTFMHPDVSPERFLSNLESQNYLHADFSTSLFSYGRYTADRNGFWNMGFSMRTESDVNIPYEFFDFMKSGMTSDNTHYSISGMGLTQSVYMQFSAGYSRRINDNLRIGANIKILSSLIRMDLDIDRMDITMTPDEWIIDTETSLDVAAKGFSFEKDEEDRISSVNMTSLPGMAGFGAAIDLGAEYRFGGILEGLNLSASITDLGAVFYGRNNLLYAESGGTVNYTGFKDMDYENMDISGQVDEITGLFTEMVNLKESAPSSGVSEMLPASFRVGAEYEFFNNILSAGLLYTGRLNERKMYNELTLSCNLRPSKTFALSCSYSFMNIANSIGWALHVTPPYGINFFVGSDYTYLKYSTYYVPLDDTFFNVHFGVSIPIQGGKMRRAN